MPSAAVVGAMAVCCSLFCVLGCLFPTNAADVWPHPVAAAAPRCWPTGRLVRRSVHATARHHHTIAHSHAFARVLCRYLFYAGLDSFPDVSTLTPSGAADTGAHWLVHMHVLACQAWDPARYLGACTSCTRMLMLDTFAVPTLQVKIRCKSLTAPFEDGCLQTMATRLLPSWSVQAAADCVEEC